MTPERYVYVSILLHKMPEKISSLYCIKPTKFATGIVCSNIAPLIQVQAITIINGHGTCFVYLQVHAL